MNDTTCKTSDLNDHLKSRSKHANAITIIRDRNTKNALDKQQHLCDIAQTLKLKKHLSMSIPQRVNICQRIK